MSKPRNQPRHAVMLKPTEISDDLMKKMAYAQYGDEPCRFCGIHSTMDDMQRDKIVFAGHSREGKFMIAHKVCFETRKDDDPETWAHP